MTAWQERLAAAEAVILEFCMAAFCEKDRDIYSYIDFRHPIIERWRKARKQTMEDEKMGQAEEMLKRAVEAGLQPVIQAPPAPQQLPSFGLPDILGLVQMGIMTPRHAFGILKGSTNLSQLLPDEFEDSPVLADIRDIRRQLSELSRKLPVTTDDTNVLREAIIALQLDVQDLSAEADEIAGMHISVSNLITHVKELINTINSPMTQEEINQIAPDRPACSAHHDGNAERG